MLIDINFNFQSDARGGDPDSCSPTLRAYHKILWSKLLPGGNQFELSNKKTGIYLSHKSHLGEFSLGSDAVTHSYRNQKRKQWLTSQIRSEVDELYDLCSNIGAYVIFPNNRIEGKRTINAERGCNYLIDDRFDLTLESIRLFYIGQRSPLYETLLRYKSFFDLFDNFNGYVHFFLLDDLVDERGQIKFYLPFDNFKTPPTFAGTDDYLLYKRGVLKFVQSRARRIEEFAKLKMAE